MLGEDLHHYLHLVGVSSSSHLEEPSASQAGMGRGGGGGGGLKVNIVKGQRLVASG